MPLWADFAHVVEAVIRFKEERRCFGEASLSYGSRNKASMEEVMPMRDEQVVLSGSHIKVSKRRGDAFGEASLS